MEGSEKPMYEIKVSGKGVFPAPFTINEKFQFVVRLEGEIIAISKFIYDSVKQAHEQAINWADANARF